jgi:high-affinity nickel permease
VTRLIGDSWKNGQGTPDSSLFLRVWILYSLMYTPLVFSLSMGLILGIKHAMDADHVVAVTNIVTEQRSVLRSARVGLLWGLGHSAALLVAGLFLILLQVTIPEAVAPFFEFLVALMIIFLGTRLIYHVLSKREDVHVHTHAHGGQIHSHLHFHGSSSQHKPYISSDHQSHEISSIGLKPLLVGLIHGLAGSAGLTLLVIPGLHTEQSAWIDLVYLVTFGFGSIAGMLMMSTIISIPIVLASGYFTRLHTNTQIVAGLVSVIFGIYYMLKAANSISDLHL